MNGRYTFDPEEALRLWKQGLTDQQIGDKLGVEDKYIGRWRRKNGLVVQKKEACFDEALARDMWKDGACDPEIAKAVHVSQDAIRAWRYRNGMKGNQYTGPRKAVEGYHQDTERLVQKDNPMAPGHVDKLVDKFCRGCKHLSTNGHATFCEYILHTKKKRPCPPGKGCTEREFAPMGGRCKVDRQEALQLHSQGMRDSQIAEAMGVTPQAVRKWRIRNDLPSNTNYNRDWPREKAKELYDQGMSDREIAAELDVAYSVIWGWRNKEGLKRNGK